MPEHVPGVAQGKNYHSKTANFNMYTTYSSVKSLDLETHYYYMYIH